VSVTLGDLVAEVEDFLSSHGADRDKVCTLSVAMTPSDTTFTVDDATQVDRGLVEVDYELIQVTSKNNTTGVVTCPPWGRGQRGTTAAVHSQNVRVAVNPKFPRSRIRTEINLQLSNLLPDLFATAVDTSNTVQPAVITYPLPAAAEGILKVGIQAIGPSKMWIPTSGIRFDYTADTTAFPTGRTFDLLQHRGQVGRTIQVVYMTGFTPLALDSDTLSAAGADDSWRDIITLGVCARLIAGLDSSKLQTTSVEQQNHAAYVQAGTGAAVAKQLLLMQQMRLAQERALLFQRFPTRVMHSD
jgi:hypothetical protein